MEGVIQMGWLIKINLSAKDKINITITKKNLPNIVYSNINPTKTKCFGIRTQFT